MKKLLTFYFLFLTSICLAQTVKVKVPQNVATGDNFRLAFVFDTQDVEGFKLGELPEGLEVLAGPYTSSSSSFQMVNGHTTSSSTLTYTYTIYAAKEGTYTIPAAHGKAGGKDVASQTVTIAVSGDAPKQSNRRQQRSTPSVREAGTKISANDLFIKVSANKQRVVEQEPVLITYKVYTLVDLSQLQGKMPDLKGFHTQEIELPQQKSFHIENLNGRNYRCVTWSQYVVFPQMTGELTIPSITFKGVVLQQNRNIDPFEAFFNGGSSYVEVKHDIVAPAVNIKVEPLPQKPDNFYGGVGQYNIAATVDKEKVKAGDPITLKVKVSGKGNMELLRQPEPEFPSDFDKYDPKQTSNTRTTAEGVEGSVTYEYLVVPRNQGDYTIPTISYAYYDTGANAFKTLTTEPITLTVEKGSGQTTQVVSGSTITDNDIRELKVVDKSLSPRTHKFYDSGLYYALLLFLVGAFVILLIVFRQRAIDNADIVKKRGRQANKVATKRLHKAFRLMQQGSDGDFYDEVLRALWGYVGDKLNMPVTELSRDNITERLTKSTIDEDTISTFIAALDDCEFARYAPGDKVGNMNKTYTSASEAITTIENKTKTKTNTNI